MELQKFNSANAAKLAAMIIGHMSMGSAHTCVIYKALGCSFTIEIADWKNNQHRYFADADHATFPRDEKASDLISDNVYQTVCRFWGEVNTNLVKHLF